MLTSLTGAGQFLTDGFARAGCREGDVG